MNQAKSPDEKSKRKIAGDVVSEKRKYFVPTHTGGEIEAESPEQAVKLARSESIAKGSDNDEKDGDA